MPSLSKNSFLLILAFSVVNLTLLYNDNEGCHSRESGNPDVVPAEAGIYK
jgi:hypothetical protein